MSEKQDLKALAKTLSDSYSAILQYSTLKDDEIRNHVEQLSKYSDHLPLSWFTPQLIEALLSLKDRNDYVFNLWTVWVRRLSGAPEALASAEPQLSRVLEAMQQALVELETPLLIRKEAWIGLIALCGTAPPQFTDTQIIQAMTRVLEQYVDHPELVQSMGETLDAGIAHCLANTTLLNVFEVDHCERLISAYVKLIPRRPTDVSAPAAMAAMQHVVDVRVQQKPQTKANADMETLIALVETMDEKESLELQLARFTILAGVVRMLQFTKDKSKKIKSLQEQLDKTFVERFSLLVTDVYKHPNSVTVNQDILAYIAGQCLPNLPSDTVKEMDHKNVLRILISCLLTSDQIWQNGQIVGNLTVSQHSVDHLKKITEGAIHKDIGRISRAIATVIVTGLGQEEEKEEDSMAVMVQSSLDRLVGFSYNILVDWDRFMTNNPKAFMDSESKKIMSEIDTAVWLVFKTMLFSFTAILKSVAVDIPDLKGLVNVQYAAQDIVSIFANFQFITDHLGSGSGFKAYQDTITNAVAFLMHDDNACQLNKLISTAYREYAPSQFTMDQTHPISLLSPVQLSRLTYFTNLIEQVMSQLEDKVLEKDILPVIYPVLKWKKPAEKKDLYESAHSAVLAVFSSQKEISRELTGVYAPLLVESFPEPMTLQQLRFAYTTMIQSLCMMDDALSWLAANYLIEKINTLSIQEKDSVLHSQYTTALIDLLKPLSLGPFFGQLLKVVESLVLQGSMTTGARNATMKIIFETVSGSGISDMRRVEAVGWFLELKRKVKILEEKIQVDHKKKQVVTSKKSFIQE
ncbi:hypothetical protein BDA99DRAFT_510987 [Phascolomyces articulosus]|uniref:Uncharacterized protein n=1 Tax=Phascolomyces articulosus TaxID=60185 RepID=A0AAD5PDI6_9FUNG|nr:hypothetical protein BDA99DRAFT_510987 [Phascolomyces articulosus]